MTPGLTCAACQQPFGGQYARITDAGCIHAPGCKRRCQVAGCDRLHHAAGYCGSHWKRWKRHGDPLAGGVTNRPLTAEDIEDLEWMAATGENITGACRRLGRQKDSLNLALKRAGRLDLYRALANREGDWNAPANHAAVVRRSSDERKYQARQDRFAKGAA